MLVDEIAVSNILEKSYSCIVNGKSAIWISTE